MPSIAFIPNVYIADSLRARTLINLSAVSNIDLNFVPSVAFIPNVYIADSLRARTPINLSAVLYEQAATQTSLSAKVSNISPRARTLINPSAVLYEQVSIIDLNFVPSVTFNAIGNVELTGNLLGNADRVNNNNNNVAPTPQFSLTALLNPRSLASKRPASSSSNLNCRRTNPTIASNDDNVQLVRDNIEELIYISKVKHTYVQAYTVPYPNPKKYLSNSTRNNRNNLNIIVTNPTSREFSRVNIKSSTRLCLLIDRAKRYNYYNLQDSDSLTQIQAIDPIISKLNKVPTQEPSSYIKTELLRDNSRKFYRLIITSKDTHYKQTIKKAYIISLERALLILFIT
ncbi:hypothetical protein HBI12_242110 [Parastagonospora nodorum]|nr:hypothetical protein HBI12_242110 [Parastagonospora nodorum]